MIRTQISLTEQQMTALKREAQRRQTSIAAVVRNAVDAELSKDDRDERWRRAMAVIGSGDSGRTDIGQNHDLYLDPDHEP